MEVIEEIKTACSLDLLEYIRWKDEYPKEAQAAFSEFCLRFDQTVLKTAEINCKKWNLSATVALDIVNCTFARVWKYTSYNHEKSKTENIDNGIKRWLSKIVFTQLTNYSNRGTCFEPDKETDLSLIYTLDDFVEKSTVDTLKRKELKEQLSVLDDVINSLGEKHRIIYLTYKLYTHEGNNIPRDVSKKLQIELGLVPGSIRKYKEQANLQVKSFLNQYNGR
ncbi:MAG: RNA polymerase subunit sigma [Bacteroidetes bacterium HGW-Bacteroidetes-4]|nr:MAG: RNA polymerase subunit sigma [Bacteroidetes bacterium HGW-Bacteroidetes-4]